MTYARCLRLCLLAFCLLPGCQRPSGGDSKTLAAQIEEATEGHVALLGSGYQNGNHQFTDTECVMGEKSPLSTMSEGSIQAFMNMTQDDLQRFFGGSVSTTFPIFPGVSATGEINLTHHHVGGKFSESISILYKGKGAYQALDDNSLQITPQVKDWLKTLPPNIDKEKALFDLCGDQFVKGVEQGVSLMATLKIDYDGDFESNVIGGSVAVGISKIGVGALSSIEALMPRIKIAFDGTHQEQAARATMRLMVYQKGGQPERVLNLLPIAQAGSGNDDLPGALVCAFEEREFCLRAFERVATYIRESLPQQLAEGRHLTPIAYLTDDYVQEPVSSLAPSTERLVQRSQETQKTLQLRTPLVNAWNQLDQDQEFLDTAQRNIRELLVDMGYGADACSFANASVPAGLCEAAQLLGLVSERRLVLSQALAACDRIDDLVACEINQKIALEQLEKDGFHIDRERLQNLPRTFDVWCQQYFAEGILAPERKQTVRALIGLTHFPIDDLYRKRGDDEAGFPLADSCHAAALELKDLQAKGVLDLRRLGIKDLLPLASLFDAKAIDLSGNNIQTEDLSPLAYLQNIRCLDLSDNILESLTRLETLLPAADRKIIVTQNFVIERLPSNSWPWTRTVWDEAQSASCQ